MCSAEYNISYTTTEIYWSLIRKIRQSTNKQFNFMILRAVNDIKVLLNVFSAACLLPGSVAVVAASQSSQCVRCFLRSLC